MNNLVDNSIKFACKLGIDPNNNISRLHKKRLVPKKLN